MSTVTENHPADTTSVTSRDPALVGAGYALLAYLSWGFMPVYWKWVSDISALQMVAHRVVWSVILLAVLLSIFRRWPAILAALRSPRQMLLLTVTSILVSGNWLIFIWAVQANHVVQASLGYYINPLLNVLLGFLFLRERLKLWQLIAVIIASTGVGILIVQEGVFPWVSLSLALTFGIYGLLRKIAATDALVGLSVETALLLPIAVGYLLYCDSTGSGVFLRQGWQQDMLILLAGPVTVLPLLWFTNAARRLRYATIGFFQYLAPTCQLLLAVQVYDEPFTSTHAITFGCIWLALAIYTADSQWTAYRTRQRVQAAQ